MTVSQIALAVILLSGPDCWFAACSRVRAQRRVATPRVIVMQLPLPGTKYPTSADRLTSCVASTSASPRSTAIEASSTTSNAPLGGGAAVQFSIDGRQTGTAERAPLVTMLAIGSGYFDVLRSPLLRGRSFTDIDGLPGRDVAIVNERFAAMYFAGVDPIGHSIQLSQNPSLRTVSGTPPPRSPSSACHRRSGSATRASSKPDPVVYVPRPAVAQTNRATLLVRTARNQAETTAMLREEIRALDPDMPIFNVRTLDTDLANQRWPLIVVGSTFGLFASIGLVLSAIGLFGLTSYSVATRMKEIALRMALGAMPSSVLWLLFGRVVAQVMLGLALGVAGAYALGRVLQGMLVQTSPTDQQVLAAAGVVLLLVASVTCLVPARRATRIEPLAVLRSGQ